MNLEDIRTRIKRLNNQDLMVLYRFDTDKEIRFDISGKYRAGWAEFKPDMVTEEGVRAAEIEIEEKEIEGEARQKFHAMYQSLLIKRGKA